MREVLRVSNNFKRLHLNDFFILGLSGGSRQGDFVKIIDGRCQFEALVKQQFISFVIFTEAG